MARKADNVTKTGALIVLLTLLVLAFLSATAGYADLLSIAAHKLLHADNSSTGFLSREKLVKIVGMQKNAARLSSLHADYQLDLALLYQSHSDISSGTGGRQVTQQAAEHARLAVIRRSAWARAWSELAIARFNHSGFDSQVQVALSKAQQLGSWERGVVSQVAWLAMTAWSQLPRQQQEMSAFFISAMKEPQFSQIIHQSARRTGWSGFLRRLEREHGAG
ncbi:hypothetical protein [Solemya elarraichensis gill symbiont]|uniref:Uncharacterized protein n=1 Tax=Solemya elarraichensis gill symbiont TaxID=1918949 RepID=A0A1T2L0M8_9GAMM|nr:hypothetical protein [Solemya elarraichensis gill symbiont]OOZ38667.1 hypothetical protein BOW52_08175 [Solemya elarraichensis gill symbiont]